MEELRENAQDFIETADEALEKQKWNVAVANYFRALTNLCDYLIYEKIRIFPKNHNERFNLLKKHFENIYREII